MLNGKDIRAIIHALAQADAGVWDGQGPRPDFMAALSKIQDLKGRQLFAFTAYELSLLNMAISAGVGDDGIGSVGLTKREQHRLAKIANDLAEALKPGHRPYWETEPKEPTQ